MGSFIQNHITQHFDVNIFLIFLLSRLRKSGLLGIIQQKNMGYGKNAQSAAYGKLPTLFSLTIHQYLKMAIILDVKNVVLPARKNKEDKVDMQIL